MTKRLLDFNPLSGEKVWFEYTAHNDEVSITHEQDVSDLLDLAHYRATDGNYSAKGIKDDWWHYAKVPNSVIIEMKQKHGVDFFSKNDAKRVFQLLNSEYKRFKTTEKTHNVRY